MNKELVKNAISYYIRTTGNTWDDFYSKMNSVMLAPLEAQTGDNWLAHSIMGYLKKNGCDREEIVANKDLIKSWFDFDDMNKNGEYFTPEVWANEARNYIKKYISDWETDYTVWDASCGTGNLLRNSGIDPSHLYLSTLQDTDVETLKGIKQFDGANIFQLDFLSKVNHDDYNLDLLNALPEGLRNVILNDKPLLVFMNPPYSFKGVKTEVGNYMISCRTIPEYDFIDLRKSAGELCIQFMFQVMDLVRKFKLKNLYFCLFCPTSLFIRPSYKPFFKLFNGSFEYLDGFFFNSVSFENIAGAYSFTISVSLFKACEKESTGCCFPQDKKILSSDKETVITDGRMVVEPPKKKMVDWVKPQLTDSVILPAMTSHTTFDGANIFEPKVYETATGYVDAFCYWLSEDVVNRSRRKNGVLSLPLKSFTTIPIFEDNFWEFIVGFAVKAYRDDNLMVFHSSFEYSSPDISIEGYDIFRKNCLAIFLCAYTNFMVSLDNVDFFGDKFSIGNKLFFLTEEEIRSTCTDDVILKDLDERGLDNQFLIEQLRESEPYFVPEVKELYEWVKGYVMGTYNFRKNVEYKWGLNRADASFQQIRAVLWDTAKFEQEYQNRVRNVMDYIKENIFKYKFLS